MQAHLTLMMCRPATQHSQPPLLTLVATLLTLQGARYIVEAPPNICTPTHLARAAEAIAAAAPDVFSCQILEQADCEAMRMGCYLGVTACSAEPPKFIHLTYKPSGEP